MAFTKKLLRSGRTTGPLIISVTEPEQANRLINAGLIWQYELHDCEPFDGDCVITQCFKCYQYGHIGHRCRNTQRCGFCAAPGHATNDCTGKEDCMKHLCVSCQGNHPSWARECPVRAKHAEAAKLAYINRPMQYQATSSFVRRHQQTTAPTPQNQAGQAGQASSSQSSQDEPIITAATDHPLEDWQEPWIEVSHKRAPSPRSTSAPPAKRPRGRPFGSTRASKNTKDICTFTATQ